MEQKNEFDTSLDYKLLIKVIRLASPMKVLLFITILYAIIIAVLVPLRPELFQRLIDNSILGTNGNIQILIIAIVVSLIAETLFQYLFIYSSSLLGQSVVKDLRTKVFKHVVNLKLSYFDKTPIGTTTTRTVNDIETINDIFTQGFIRLIADILTLVFIAAWMLVKNWKLALVSMIALPIMVLATYIFKESVKSAFQKVRTQVALLNAFLQEHITGMRIVQIFSAEQQELTKFKEINNKHKKANIEAIWAYSIFFPVVEILLAVATGLMVWVGATLLIQNKLITFTGEIASVGLIVQFVLLINALFRPIRFMAERFNTMQMGLVAANRVFKLLDRTDFIEDKGTISNIDIEGKIEFNKVKFAYIANDYVLKDVSFTVPAGKTLAIVGQTGSGKSSIINLLTRLYEWQDGNILLDGISIKDYKLEFYRKQMSTVLQEDRKSVV